MLRWNQPERGPLSPAVFIPVAESSRFIVELGEFVLREACARVAATSGLQLSVNLSSVQLLDDRLVARIERVLAETGLAPGRLELEVTEGYLIEQEDSAAGMLARLREVGMRISLDDFGSGFASLGYLRRFPLDKVKIDRSFVAPLERDPRAQRIAAAVVALCRAFDIPITAEGVETEGQASFLRAAGCDCFQGFLFGRPMAELPEMGPAIVSALRA